jgi:hypothetical protein
MASKKKDGGGDECAYCSTNEGDLKKCTRCRLVCYCSKSCQTAHWKAQPGHRDRCIAPKDRKPPKIQPKDAEAEATPAEIAEKDLCGVCFEPLLAQNVLESGAPHAGTQTLVCKHSFHLKCASELTELSTSPLCPLCRGPFTSIDTVTLYREAKTALDVILSMADEGQISWAVLPPTVNTRMRSIMRKHLEAANRGHKLAQASLGSIFRAGEGVKQSFKEAAKWFRLAAEQGLSEAQSNLGVMYGNGEGFEQDDTEAVKWFRLAAHQGEVFAQFSLGNMYQSGRGVKQDYKKAAKWFRLAAEQGHVQARFMLNSMSQNGQGANQGRRK